MDVPCGFPGSYAEVDAPGFTWTYCNPTLVTGVVGVYNKVLVTAVCDGLSNTFLFGEKALSPDHYDTGQDSCDDRRCLSDTIATTTGRRTPIQVCCGKISPA